MNDVRPPPGLLGVANGLSAEQGTSSASAIGCAIDAMQRSVLFLDALRRRGNSYREHLAAGEPPLLKFDSELLVDGRTLARPCNYLLLRIVATEGQVTEPDARPVVIVDPRAGHGPGIGGFKRDSEVGVALRAGHPVYFVAFRPQPEEGQTLWDVLRAEACFLEEVRRRHPASPPPLIIGNCQAGWAVASLAALRPELCGPLLIVGSPMSYWAGGSKLNPMRYSGAALGGSWLASLAADLGGDRFDGAHLVENFERLNPGNSAWSKYYRLWSQVDTETEHFLEFERWWGGFFLLTGVEIEAIVENLFIGNRLARGDVDADGERIDLRNIRAPILVFASRGDNITPPPQALNWIIDTWGSSRAIAAAGRVIVYVLHESVGHLGIFVGSDVARREHDQLVNSIDVIENLPPGLYEMKLVHKSSGEVLRWDNLEPGSYSVHFEHRSTDDLRAINPEGRDDERIFSTVAKVSELQAALYKAWLRPWLRLWLRMAPVRLLAQNMRELHPMRWQRLAFSDANPASQGLALAAGEVRRHRRPVPAEHPGRAWERAVSQLVESQWNLFRDLRDQALIAWVRFAFGPFGWGAWLPPDPPAEEQAVARAAREIDATRSEVLARIADGGFEQAVCRIVLAGMASIGTFERRSLRIARLLADVPRQDGARPVDWLELMRREARIAAVAPVEALNALPQMLPDMTMRERALAAAAAVLMIEPTLHAPRSEIIELMMGVLGADPDRVTEASRLLTRRIDPAQ